MKLKLSILFTLFYLVSFSQFEYCDKDLILDLNIDGNGSNYEWSTSLGSIINDNQLLVTQPGIYIINLDYEYYGCTYTQKKRIEIDTCSEFTIYFPSALVPSGTNSYWFPKYQNVKIESLTIWDRWGQVQWIWENDYFYGLNINGNELDGVFTYSCLYTGNKVTYQVTGRVTVVR